MAGLYKFNCPASIPELISKVDSRLSDGSLTIKPGTEGKIGQGGDMFDLIIIGRGEVKHPCQIQELISCHRQEINSPVKISFPFDDLEGEFFRKEISGLIWRLLPEHTLLRIPVGDSLKSVLEYLGHYVAKIFVDSPRYNYLGDRLKNYYWHHLEWWEFSPGVDRLNISTLVKQLSYLLE